MRWKISIEGADGCGDEPAPGHAVALKLGLAAFKGIPGNVFQPVEIAGGLALPAFPFLDRVQACADLRPRPWPACGPRPETRRGRGQGPSRAAILALVQP